MRREALQRLLDDVIQDASYVGWREDARAATGEAPSAEQSLLADVLADPDYVAFRATLRARAAPRPPSRLRTALSAAGALAAAAALVWALVVSVPSSARAPRPQLPVAQAPSWHVHTRPLRDGSRAGRAPGRLVAPKTARLVVVAARRAPVAAAASPSRLVVSGRSRIRWIRTPRSGPRGRLSDRELLALLPPCGLVQTGPRSKRLWFFHPGDERRLVGK